MIKDKRILATQVDSSLQQMAAEGKAAGTIANCKVALRKFVKFVNQTDVARIDRETVCRFGEYLVKQEYTAKYNVSLSSAVRQFFDWLVDQGVLLSNPASRFAVEGGRCARLPLYMSKEEVKRLLDSTTEITERTVLEMLYSTGMRVAELCALKLSDVDFAGACLRIREGKGRKERVVPIGKSALRYLEQYMKESPKLGSGEKLLGISRDRVWELVSRAGRRVGLAVYPHLLRHSFAVHLLESGADITEIAAMLGHARLRTTQIYTQLVPLQLKKEFLRCHPAAVRCGTLPEIAPVKMCESGRTGKKWNSAKNEIKPP